MKRCNYAVVAAVVSAFVLMGCGGNSKAGTKSGGVEAEPGPFGKYKEPLTVTWGISTSSVQQFKPGDSYESNVWNREFKDSLNIDLKVNFTADGASGAYDNQLNLGLASGDLPDVVRIENYRIFEQGARAGLWADLSGVFDEYASDWLKAMRKQYTTAFNFAQVDGKLYGIPPLNDNRQNAALLWIRDDWLQKVGMKAPTTIDELIEVARAFTFNDPDGNGRDDTYGLALQNKLVEGTFGHLHGFFSAFGVPSYEHISYYRDENGKMTFSYLNPRTKDALEVLARIYKEGLIDPEFTVKDVNKIGEDMTSGRVGMDYGLNWGTWWGWNGLYSATGLTAHPYAIPTVPGIKPVIAHQNNMASGIITTISSKHSNPEALIKMFNLHASIINIDMADETYAKYDKDEQWRLTPALINEPYETIHEAPLHAAFDKGSAEGLPNYLISRYGQIMGYLDGTDKTADSYGLWGQFYVGNSMDIIMNQYIPNGCLLESQLGPVWPQSLIDNDASLQKITVQAFTEIITGTKPLSAYDTYVTDWLRAGGQQVLDDLDKMYPAK